MKTATPSKESKLLVVCYHYIRKRNQYKYPGIHPIELEEFYTQVKYLNDNFHMATPEELEEFILEYHSLEQPSIFLTFDDGLKDQAIAAEEVLDQFNIKGGFFISTKPLTEHRLLMVHKIHWLRATSPPDKFRKEFESILEIKQHRLGMEDDLSDIAIKTYPFDTQEDARLKYYINYLLPTDLVDDISSEMLKLRDIGEEELFKITYMNESDIRRLFFKGHIIGCHGHTHAPFSNLNDEELAAELKTNISILEGIIQREISWISYPYGMKWSVPQNSDKVWVDLGLRMGFNLGFFSGPVRKWTGTSFY